MNALSVAVAATAVAVPAVVGFAVVVVMHWRYVRDTRITLDLHRAAIRALRHERDVLDLRAERRLSNLAACRRALRSWQRADRDRQVAARNTEEWLTDDGRDELHARFDAIVSALPVEEGPQ